MVWASARSLNLTTFPPTPEWLHTESPISARNDTPSCMLLERKDAMAGIPMKRLLTAQTGGIVLTRPRNVLKTERIQHTFFSVIVT